MQHSKVMFKNIDLSNRIDAEYFQPNFLNIENRLRILKSKSLSNYCSITGSAFYPAATELYQYGEVPFIRCVDCINYPVITSNQDETFEKIPKWFSNEYKNIKKLKNNDIVITKVGSPCYASVIRNIGSVALSRTVLGLKEIQNINPYYLTVYLRSKYGFSQLWRERELTIQYQLTLDRVGNILIYKPQSLDFEKIVADLLLESQNTNDYSLKLYSQAEQILLEELGLANWQAKHKLTFVKSYSDTQQAERIDAEYFQPKYEQIEKAIKSYKGGYSFIKDEFKQNKTSFNIKDNETYQYIEIGSVNVSSGEIIANKVLGSELPANAKRVLKKNDIIISKVRTYRGAISIINRDGYIGSGAFTILHEKGQVNKETLLIFLHSKPMLEWSLKPNTGTSYPVITDCDILNLPIPVLPKEKQMQIQKKIQISFEASYKSKKLLEIAKQGVEMAIETTEKKAEAWIKTKLKNL